MRPLLLWATAALLVLGTLPGCGKSSSSSSADDSSSTSGKAKTYTSDAKGGSKAGGQSGGQSGSSGSGGSATLPSPADTTTSKPSSASDDGTQAAIKGQLDMTPGAPAPKPPTKSPASH